MEEISALAGMGGREEMEINSCSPPPQMVIDALLLSRRQGSKRACNLMDSYVPNP
jgi:hypothetical protein